ncbi:MAG TPA: biotin--[acetyl-CoA-carboxylase] ligase [Glaciihabitans sp.]|jgi:BirA family biotin operon repressor/biotin-[acetyl-CoA-carboxylase] ligase|nr:biotin--[acetyl-CoA-carboxylase] ligase [Glaciihabitans sp.]
MSFPRSSEVASLTVLEQTPSTNDDLRAIAATSPEFTAVVTLDQTQGRGRMGRVWSAPAGQCLAVSVLLRPTAPSGQPLTLDAFGWLPLLAGLAMTRTVANLVPDHRVSLKWPNDVLVDGKKVCGLLAELLPTADGVVMGSGVNLSIPADNLPTPVSTSLGLEGATLIGDELADAVLAGYLTELRALYSDYLSHNGDARRSGLLAAVSAECSSIGQQVRVELPGGGTLTGVATGLDSAGRLLVKNSADATVQAVAAGDVTHLRYE